MYASSATISKIRKCIGEGYTNRNAGRHTMFFDRSLPAYQEAIKNLDKRFNVHKSTARSVYWEIKRGKETLRISLTKWFLTQDNSAVVTLM